MTKEFAACGVDAISTAAEVNAVQVKLEDLIFRKFPFDGKREDHLADFARPCLVVSQEHIARELLRNRRAALREAAARIANLKRSRDAERIDAEVAAKTLVLDGNHRGLHRCRDLVDAQPFAITGANRHDHGAVGGMDTDHLAIGRRFEFGIGRQRLVSDGYGNCDHHQADQPCNQTDTEQPPHPAEASGL